ncbi:MAG: quinol:cytochrome C oxidoreductase [Spirochaetota bacterium]|nr:quinol:cytochrome C oxidoreductase [Spirochaetota bacterium]
MTDKFVFSNHAKRTSLVLILIGFVAAVVAYFLYPEHHAQRLWANVLINNFYFVGLSLGAIFFIAIQYASNAGWSAVLKRIPEAMGSFLPVGAVLMIIFFFGGMHSLYHWTEPTYDPVIANKIKYLKEPLFLLRIVIFFGIWIFFWWILRRFSLKEDMEANYKHYKDSRKYSIIFIILFAITITYASVDWLKSLDSHWFSTMFGVYAFSGIFIHSLAVITIITILLREKGYLPYVNDSHYHDLGRYIFAFSTFWIYIGFFQFMLIWYANMPEETAYVVDRVGGSLITAKEYMPIPRNTLLWLFILNIGVNWLVPFLALMSRDSKRNPLILKIVCAVLIWGHWLDIYILVMPSTQVSVIVIHEIAVFSLVFLGYAALFYYVFAHFLSRANLIPKNHPYIHESTHHHL